MLGQFCPDHDGETLSRLIWLAHCAWSNPFAISTDGPIKFARNLELEEPKSAIEGLEGLALEYSWQELQQARHVGP